MTLPATRNKTKKTSTRSALADFELFGSLEVKLGGFRKAHWKRCRHCDELTIVGIDGDMCAFRVEVDPTRITPREEAWCALQGRKTASLEIVGKAITIWARDPLDIATPSRQPIVPHHVCGQRYAGFILKPTKQRQESEVPPF